MPSFNGTGPLGQGPMTGRGRGYCTVPAGNNPGMPYGIYGIGSSPVNTSYPYQPVYGRSSNLPYRYSAYSGRSSGYFGFFRGRGAGRAFPGGAGIRGRGRRY